MALVILPSARGMAAALHPRAGKKKTSRSRSVHRLVQCNTRIFSESRSSQLFSYPCFCFCLQSRGGVILMTPSGSSAFLTTGPANAPLYCKGQRRRSGVACGEREGGRRRGRRGGGRVRVDGRQAGDGGGGAVRAARGLLAVDRGDERGSSIVPLQPRIPWGGRVLKLVLEVFFAVAAWLAQRRGGGVL